MLLLWVFAFEAPEEVNIPFSRNVPKPSAPTSSSSKILNWSNSWLSLNLIKDSKSSLDILAFSKDSSNVRSLFSGDLAASSNVSSYPVVLKSTSTSDSISPAWIISYIYIDLLPCRKSRSFLDST